MLYEIAPMLDADLHEVVELEEVTGLNRWGYDAYRRELLTNPAAIMLAARPADGFTTRRIVGFAVGSMIFDEVHINNIATHPDYRRRGIGRALLVAAMQEGRLRGGKTCVLEVRASNVSAQTMYVTSGFTTTRRRKDYYRQPTEDALEMIRSLV
jgi:ribosomal-protein-alanine N-acetyltransferase